MGSRYAPEEPLYADLHYFRVSRLRKYLVFYRPITDGIEVIRVLHGARDIDGIIADEFGVAIEDDAGSDDEENHPE